MNSRLSILGGMEGIEMKLCIDYNDDGSKHVWMEYNMPKVVKSNDLNELYFEQNKQYDRKKITGMIAMIVVIVAAAISSMF